MLHYGLYFFGCFFSGGLVRIPSGATSLLVEFKTLIEICGFRWMVAEVEAEAECARLNSMGIVDAVMSDDVDSFLFGAKYIIRNWNASNLPTATSKISTLASIPSSAPAETDSNRSSSPCARTRSRRTGSGTATVNGEGGVDVVKVYSIQEVESKLGWDRNALIFIALLNGSDYTDGLKNVGIITAGEIARGGYGTLLAQAAQHENLMQRHEIRQSIAEEFLKNGRRLLSRKRPTAGKALLNDADDGVWPQIDVVMAYIDPIVAVDPRSMPASLEHVIHPPRSSNTTNPIITHLSFTRRLPELFEFCMSKFEWSRQTCLVRFRNVVWPVVRLLVLRSTVHKLCCSHETSVKAEEGKEKGNDEGKRKRKSGMKGSSSTNDNNQKPITAFFKSIKPVASSKAPGNLPSAAASGQIHRTRSPQNASSARKSSKVDADLGTGATACWQNKMANTDSKQSRQQQYDEDYDDNEFGGFCRDGEERTPDISEQPLISRVQKSKVSKYGIQEVRVEWAKSAHDAELEKMLGIWADANEDVSAVAQGSSIDSNSELEACWGFERELEEKELEDPDVLDRHEHGQHDRRSASAMTGELEDSFASHQQPLRKLPKEKVCAEWVDRDMILVLCPDLVGEMVVRMWERDEKKRRKAARADAAAKAHNSEATTQHAGSNAALRLGSNMKRSGSVADLDLDDDSGSRQTKLDAFLTLSSTPAHSERPLPLPLAPRKRSRQAPLVVDLTGIDDDDGTFQTTPHAFVEGESISWLRTRVKPHPSHPKESADENNGSKQIVALGKSQFSLHKSDNRHDDGADDSDVEIINVKKVGNVSL
ncbi:hypothetical protein HK102_012139 [Quaeritorhiza haematococci]|nr:hypothetical protein HK102_012139 [Quaeritorhiza haematococci]